MTIDWQHVERAVAQSEPPRLRDVPAHIKFLKKYGGGVSQYMILDTLKVVEQMMPDNRIVNGNFFEALATLKLPPSELMPRMIHACLLLQATHKSERESVGNVITNAHIKSLATVNKKTALEADAVMNKAHELAAAMPDGMSAVAVSTEIGRTSIELVKFVFNLDSAFKSIDDISKSLVDKLVMGGSASTSAATETDETEMQNVIEFARDGTCNNAGMVTAKGSGFKVDTLIEPKKNESPDDTHYVIKYVNEDGSVGVKKIKIDGEEDEEIIVVMLDGLVAKYKCIKTRIALFKQYPDNAAEDSPALDEMLDKGAISFAFRKLCADPKYKKIEFRAQEKPSNKLFANSAVSRIGALRLIPLTHKIDQPPKTTPPTSNVVVNVDKRKYHLKNALRQSASENTG